MKFGGTLIYVPDVAAAVEFYERAFKMKRQYVDEGGQYAAMETGGSLLGFVRYDLADSNLAGGFVRNDPGAKPAGIEVGFEAEDVEAAFAGALAAGAIEEAKPAAKPWGQTICYVRDLNGVLVEIGTPMH